MMNYGYPNFYNPYNPTITPQQRIQQYEQANPQMFQQPVQQPMQQQPVQQQVTPQVLSTIPVSTVEEAKAYIVDPFGTPTLFYNAGKNEVYLKRTNKQTAEAEFFTFAKLDESLSDIKEEKNINTYEDNFKALNEKIDGLYSLLEPKTKKAVKNDE